MSSTEHLNNFPFLNMDEFNSAFKNGLAEPVVPSEFARKWATKEKSSSVKLQVTIFNGLIPTLCLGLIVYFTFRFEELRWYHALGAIVVCFFAFSPNLSKAFKTISTLLLLVATVYLYVTNSAFAYLIGLSFIFLVSLKLADYYALKDIVNKILNNEDLTSKLWNNGAMAIRYTNGKVIFKDKQLELKT